MKTDGDGCGAQSAYNAYVLGEFVPTPAESRTFPYRRFLSPWMPWISPPLVAGIGLIFASSFAATSLRVCVLAITAIAIGLSLKQAFHSSALARNGGVVLTNGHILICQSSTEPTAFLSLGLIRGLQRIGEAESQDSRDAWSPVWYELTTDTDRYRFMAHPQDDLIDILLTWVRKNLSERSDGPSAESEDSDIRYF